MRVARIGAVLVARPTALFHEISDRVGEGGVQDTILMLCRYCVPICLSFSMKCGPSILRRFDHVDVAQKYIVESKLICAIFGRRGFGKKG
jgi:hypothetical protein